MKHISISMEADVPDYVKLDELKQQLSSTLYTQKHGLYQETDLECAENLKIVITEKTNNNG